MTFNKTNKSVKVELDEYFEKSKIDILQISFDNIKIIKTLPLHHRDPFDRMLIAQVLTEKIPIISADTKFDFYTDIQRIW